MNPESTFEEQEPRYTLQVNEKPETYKEICTRVALTLIENQDNYFKVLQAFERQYILPDIPLMINAGVDDAFYSDNGSKPCTKSSNHFINAYNLLLTSEKEVDYDRINDFISCGYSVGVNITGIDFPISFMEDVERLTEENISAFTVPPRHKALMSIIHPSIENFIDLRTPLIDKVIGIDDEFLDLIRKSEPHAKAITQKILQHQLPVVFTDRLEKTVFGKDIHPSVPGFCHAIPTESPAPVLHLNLSKMSSNGDIDFGLISETLDNIIIIVDALYNCISFPLLPKMEETLKEIKPFTISVFGFAELLADLSIEYNTKESHAVIRKIFGYINNILQMKTKSDSQFHHCATVALPTPSFITKVTQTTPGIEPFASLVDPDTFTISNPRFKSLLEEADIDADLIADKLIENNGSCQNINEVPDDLKDIFLISSDFDPSEHLAFQAVAQKSISNIISKSIPFGEDYMSEDGTIHYYGFEETLVEAYDNGNIMFLPHFPLVKAPEIKPPLKSPEPSKPSEVPEPTAANVPASVFELPLDPEAPDEPIVFHEAPKAQPLTDLVKQTPKTPEISHQILSGSKATFGTMCGALNISIFIDELNEPQELELNIPPTCPLLNTMMNMALTNIIRKKPLLDLVNDLEKLQCPKNTDEYTNETELNCIQIIPGFIKDHIKQA